MYILGARALAVRMQMLLCKGWKQESLGLRLICNAFWDVKVEKRGRKKGVAVFFPFLAVSLGSYRKGEFGKLKCEPASKLAFTSTKRCSHYNRLGAREHTMRVQVGVKEENLQF